MTRPAIHRVARGKTSGTASSLDSKAADYQQLRYRIDMARRFPTPATRTALLALLEQIPDALRSRHVLWNLGIERIAYLRTELQVSFDADIYDWLKEKGLIRDGAA